MRLALVISSLLIGSSAFANCLGEAQIIAKVTAIEKTLISCVAKVSAESVTLYNMSGVCPLALEDVISQGVSVGLENGHDCRLSVGDVLTGVLVLDTVGNIYLE